jgi:hypothetical protein
MFELALTALTSLAQACGVASRPHQVLTAAATSAGAVIKRVASAHQQQHRQQVFE